MKRLSTKEPPSSKCSAIAYCQGQFVAQNEAAIPLTDRGFLFGDGAYATVRVSEGRADLLERHWQRLEGQCKSLGLRMPPFDPQIVSELIALNEAEKGVWRLKIIVTGGDAPELFLPEREGRLVMLLGAYNPPPCKPLRLGIFPYPFHLCHAYFKSLAHLNRLYVSQEARRQGVDDCITLTESGVVLEASFGNLFWTAGKTFYTPSPELPLYFGVTIEQMVLQAQEEGYEIVYTKTPLEKLPQKAHYYRTGSMAGVVPIASIGSTYFAGS